MSQGKDFLVFVSATSGGTATEIELQGDLTINTGKGVTSKQYKNGQEAGQTENGFNISFEMGNSAPLATGEALIWDLHDDGDVGYFQIKNAKTGGIEWTFAGRVAIPTVATPTSGTSSVTVNVAAEGKPVRSVKSSGGGG